MADDPLKKLDQKLRELVSHLLTGELSEDDFVKLMTDWATKPSGSPDAIKMIVRGFDTQSQGELLVQHLTECGFAVEEVFDGSEDNWGGLIETEIADVAQLVSDDPDDLRQRVLEGTSPDVSCGYISYRKLAEKEDR